MVAVNNPRAGGLQLAKSSADGDQVRMHQLDQRAAQEEVKPDESDQRRRIVEHSAGRFLHLAALFDEIGFENLPQAAESPQRFDHLLQRGAPGQRVRINVAQDRLHDLRDVAKLDLFVINLRRHLERKILRQHEVDFVPVNVALLGFAQMPRDQGAKPALAVIESGHLQKLAKLMHQDALVHLIQPFVYLAEELHIRFFRERALCLRKGDFQFQLFGERQVDREHRARFFPLRLPRTFRSSWSWDIQRRSRFVHGCVTTQSQGPCENRTATALRPSRYCMPTTVASAGRPSPSASMRTCSSNSSGKVERKIACSGLPNSTTAASRRLLLPPRRTVTCTGMRTRLACGKNRANCSAQANSVAVSVRPPDLPTLPLALAVRFRPVSRGEAHYSPLETQTSEVRDARWTPKGWKPQVTATCRKGEPYVFPGASRWLTRLTVKRFRLRAGPIPCPGRICSETFPVLLRGQLWVDFTAGGAGLNGNIVALQFSVQRRSADPEHFSGQRLVAVSLLEYSQNGHPLHLRERRGGQVRGVLRCGHRRIGLLAPNSRRQIGNVDGFSVAQRHCACDAVFQLPDVSRPVIVQQTLHRRGCDLHVRAFGIAIQKMVNQHGNV